VPRLVARLEDIENSLRDTSERRKEKKTSLFLGDELKKTPVDEDCMINLKKV
jgi:hypothetical protein